MIHCGLCEDRSFGTQDAFDAHCVSAGAHKGRYCKKCKRPCRTDAEFQRHVRRDHGPVYRCDKCNVPPFSSCELMQRHFSVSNRHPDCERCREGIEDDDLLEKHTKSKHPQKQCIVCGIFVYMDELETHYLESLNHRNCARCNIGFETEQLYDEHLATVHIGEKSPSVGSPTSLSGDQQSQSYLRSTAALNGEFTMAAHLGRLQSPFTDATPRDVGGAYQLLPSELCSEETSSSTIAGLRGNRYGMLSSPPVNHPASLGPSRLLPAPAFLAHSSESVSSPPRTSGFGTPSNGFPPMSVSAVSPPAPQLHVQQPTTNGNFLSHNSTPTKSPVWSSPLLPTSVSRLRVAPMSPTISRFTEPDVGFQQQKHDVVQKESAGAATHTVPALHCRICHANPCINMTATFCGHIFCNRCITNRILSTPYCPVCDAATLLYMLFKLDLSG